MNQFDLFVQSCELSEMDSESVFTLLWLVIVKKIINKKNPKTSTHHVAHNLLWKDWSLFPNVEYGTPAQKHAESKQIGFERTEEENIIQLK